MRKSPASKVPPATFSSETLKKPITVSAGNWLIFHAIDISLLQLCGAIFATKESQQTLALRADW